MRALVMTAAILALAGGSALAQAPAAPAAAPPAMNVFASSADVQALIANARKMHKPGEPNYSQHILSLAPYNANLEYRTGLAPAAVHDKDAELFYVIDGSGTLVVGGALVGGTRTNPANMSGTAISGGETRQIAKGDFIIVPQGTPHQITAVNGELILMTFHAPRG